MSKRFLLTALVVVLSGGLLAWLVPLGIDWFQYYQGRQAVTEEEITRVMAERFGTPTNAPVSVERLDLKQVVRLAIGGIGLANEDQNRHVADLALAQLAGAKGLEMVERQSLDAVLRELSLSSSELVRAKDAVRVGRLLRADWFLLGSPLTLHGTNYAVLRIVDARTGVLYDAQVFDASMPPTQLAFELSGFVQRCREDVSKAKSKVFLSVGTFEDVSLNNRRATLPTELRGYLIAAYQRSNVALLEREFADALYQEMQLDLAGFTESTNTAVMQSAYWMVTGGPHPLDH